MRYPIVLIHGLYGYGHEDEVKNSDLLPYWGYKGNNLVEHLKSEGHEVYYPSLGPYNSAWDRACILWAYLFGGRVDYGEAHARRKGHKRFGDAYPGVLKDLGKTKAHAKIDLFGHSFGGATVKEISSLFTQGDEQEKKSPGHSPLFDGGHGDLIHTVTTLSGVNNGTTAATLTAYTGLSFATVMGVMLSEMTSADSPEQCDYMLSQWKGGPIAKGIRYNLNDTDNIAMEMDINTVQRKVNPRQVVNKNTYYFAQRAFKSPSKMTGACQYCGSMIELSANLTGNHFKRDDLGWRRNDGFVNLVGQSAPLNQKYKDGYWSGTEFKPGIWYNMPPKIEDHIYWCGHSGCIQDLYADFDRMLSLYDKLK